MSEIELTCRKWCPHLDQSIKWGISRRVIKHTFLFPPNKGLNTFVHTNMQLLKHLQHLPPGSFHPLFFSKLLFSFYIRPPQKNHKMKTKLKVLIWRQTSSRATDKSPTWSSIKAPFGHTEQETATVLPGKKRTFLRKECVFNDRSSSCVCLFLCWSVCVLVRTTSEPSCGTLCAYSL